MCLYTLISCLPVLNHQPPVVHWKACLLLNPEDGMFLYSTFTNKRRAVAQGQQKYKAIVPSGEYLQCLQ